MADISSITLPGGGTYDLKDKNAVPKYGMGKNLLDNWHFGSPVNQRGQSSYSGAVYGIDRWFGGLSTSSMTVNADSISFSAGFWNQYLDLKRIQEEKTYTLSVYFKSGNFYTISGAIPEATSSQQTVMTMVLDSGNVSIIIPTNGRDYVRFAGENLNIYAVKLELGTEQTLAHLEGSAWVLNEVPDYEYELYRCITSTADSTDTYANKTLANEQELAYVETGTTASRAYAEGEYFFWNGLSYRAKTAISSGGTFTPNTNCEQETGGVANSLANQIVVEILVLPNTGSVSPNTNATVSTTIPAKTGYVPVACAPVYTGDDQFCWVACALTSNNTQASATVRNVSSSADSGAPKVFVIYQKV